MFTQNGYYTKYNEIIINRQNNPYDGYTESHHIIPVSLGGSNEPTNLVALSAEEHLKVHTLLPYFTSGTERDSMVYAWNMMSNRNGIPADYKEYSILKEDHSKIVSKFQKERGTWVGEDNPFYGVDRSGDNNPFHGKNHSQKSLDQMSEASKGIASGSNNGMFGVDRKGSKNINVKIIEIYDVDGVCKFKSTENFREMCKKLELPYVALSESYRTGGSPIYQKKIFGVLKRYRQYKGWYALILGSPNHIDKKPEVFL